MKKYAITATMFMLFAAFPAWAQHARYYSATTPQPSYISPKNQSVVDLTGKDALTFKWDMVPIPGGGRDSYKFTLYKEFGNDVILSKTLAPDVYSIDVPADMFEDGGQYTWQVRQRDDNTMNWSLPERWSFRVVKGAKK
jgi:hypothetical protein